MTYVASPGGLPVIVVHCGPLVVVHEVVFAYQGCATAATSLYPFAKSPMQTGKGLALPLAGRIASTFALDRRPNMQSTVNLTVLDPVSFVRIAL